MIKRIQASLDEDGPFAGWLTWGHLAITLSLIAFLFNLWQHNSAEAAVAASERVKLEARVATLESMVQQQRRVDREQNDMIIREMQLLATRIDQQRADIRSLQEAVIRHMQADRR